MAFTFLYQKYSLNFTFAKISFINLISY